MKYPEPMSWDRTEARKGKFDGRFIVGVMTTGIYCLPSCAARPPKPQNVRLFTTETEAKAAGLRACKRCRPDLYYKGEDENVALFEGLAARVVAKPEEFADASALAKAAGVSLTKLGDLYRDHAHLAPVAWLRRMRVRRAAQELLAGKDKVAEIGFGAGFESESVFHRQFLNQMRMTPGAYRALDGAEIFMLQLPAGYRAREILAYHARDPLSVSEKSEGNRIWKALHTADGPAVIEISIEASQAWVKVYAGRKLGGEAMASLHGAALRVLGLSLDVSQFETRHAAFIAPRRGLRLPLLPTGFDALCWGIIGQQINIKFASALRREIVELAGEKIGDMRAHPTPERVADIGVPVLAARRYSRSKAQYLIDAAAAVAEGKLDIENLGEGSAIAAEKALTGQRGIGTWTARYVLLRGGFADAAPVGDSALATALQRLHQLAERPDADETARLMSAFAPHRSIATMHLWTYLKEAA
ncbi:MAG TPA: Ada metal-binding domain-containing protein [Rhizomicrobium sp.]|jgi:AraC family transcriptional regulator of adaptative response / DNA-3-methyladenine glycosylase II|nr:Ada metal-binding domain-containing protein [Rhizomicrobium sp.]